MAVLWKSADSESGHAVVTPRRPRVEQLDVVEVPVFTISRPPFMASAACKEHPTALWFPERGQSPAKALAICSACLVLADCREYVTANPELRGVWGGLTEADRHAIHSRRTP